MLRDDHLLPSAGCHHLIQAFDQIQTLKPKLQLIKHCRDLCTHICKTHAVCCCPLLTVSTHQRKNTEKTVVDDEVNDDYYYYDFIILTLY